jgi:xanthine dehydrogenase FAD-binding subunit
MWNEYHLCGEIEEALRYLQRYDGQARIIAGGTDLMLQLEASHDHIPALIDITRIQELQQIKVQEERIWIGAAVTLQQVISSPLLLEHSPHLIDAAREFAGPQIRHSATVVGNIVNASPAADSVPVLLTLDAQVHYLQEDTTPMDTPIEEFLTGVGTTTLPPDGLVIGVSLRQRQDGWHQGFRKLGLRRSMAIAVVNAAAALRVEEGVIQDARIAFGAVAPTAVRATDAEQSLLGAPLAQAALTEAPRLARKAVSPIDDFRASATYRDQMVENLLRQQLAKLSEIYGNEVGHGA